MASVDLEEPLLLQLLCERDQILPQSIGGDIEGFQECLHDLGEGTLPVERGEKCRGGVVAGEKMSRLYDELDDALTLAERLARYTLW